MDEFATLMIKNTALECTEASHLLNISGIPNFIKNETVYNLFGSYNPAIGGVKLVVFSKDFEKAQAVLLDNHLISPADTRKESVSSGNFMFIIWTLLVVLALTSLYFVLNWSF